MKIGVLTSSRADFGIYLPLLKAMKKDRFFSFKIIAFGTHLSALHGYTIDGITEAGFTVDYKIESIPSDDSANAIAASMGHTLAKFADFWGQHEHDFDIVFCLGDRYEMFAAVVAAIPFEITFAHFHGGETTLGAIDNTFRHSISLASKIHFVATESYGAKVSDLVEAKDHVHVVGALSLDNIMDMELLSIDELKAKFDIDLSRPTILCTFHPETIRHERNSGYANILSDTIRELAEHFQIVITLPNADTKNTELRQAFRGLEKELTGKVKCIENFGTLAYFSVMKNCSMLLGNTSSGIIEAASFKKWVIDLGDRQKGRIRASNVINVAIDKAAILKAVANLEGQGPFEGENPYDQGGAVEKIIEILKKY